MTARKSGARKAIAAAIVSAALLSGCTATGWIAGSPPAAGSQTELPSLEKVRNFLFVVDDAGEGVLLGTIATAERTEVAGIEYAAELEDGSFGDVQPIDFTAQLAPQSSVQLEGPELSVSNPDLRAGHLAAVTVDFASSGTVSLQVPVYASDHDDFADAWQAAVGG
ncbi:MAG: hypothetical protein GX596_09500 [Propionibacterium sp.]|nr:hypothetical protein [Propionibacterium sp.]